MKLTWTFAVGFLALLIVASATVPAASACIPPPTPTTPPTEIGCSLFPLGVGIATCVGGIALLLAGYATDYLIEAGTWVSDCV